MTWSTAGKEVGAMEQMKRRSGRCGGGGVSTSLMKVMRRVLWNPVMLDTTQ